MTHVAKGREAKSRRQGAAEDRRIKRSKRSDAEQLARLDALKHRAKRERERLASK